MTPNILVVGSINMGWGIRTPVPQPGETLLGRDFQTFPEGKGANQVVAAARLGADVTFIGCAGEDTFVEVADTTAAGDAFVAALAVTGLGAQPSIPTREEVEQLLKQH